MVVYNIGAYIDNVHIDMVKNERGLADPALARLSERRYRAPSSEHLAPSGPIRGGGEGSRLGGGRGGSRRTLDGRPQLLRRRRLSAA